jgi:hypothetical protein
MAAGTQLADWLTREGLRIHGVLQESRSPDIPPAESVRFGGRCECWRGGGDSLSVSLMPDGPRSGGAAVCPGNTVPRC